MLNRVSGCSEPHGCAVNGDTSAENQWSSFSHMSWELDHRNCRRIPLHPVTSPGLDRCCSCHCWRLAAPGEHPDRYEPAGRYGAH